MEALRKSGQDLDDGLLPHLSPLGWEHIYLTGDYVWEQRHPLRPGEFRPFGSPANP